MEDSDDFTQSSETASEYYESSYPDFEGILVIIEQLRIEHKDSVSLLKIRDSVQLYKKLLQLKNKHLKVLMGKFEKMDNEANGLQKKLSETEREKVERKQELHNLRSALKQEVEKRRNVDRCSEKIKEQLRVMEEQYNKEVEMKEQLDFHVRALDVELKTLRNNLNETLEEQSDTQRQLSQEQKARLLQDEILTNHLRKQKELEMAQEKTSSQLQEAQVQHTKAVQHSEKMQDCIQKLELENYELKVMTEKQMKKIEYLKKSLLSASSNKDLIEKLETESSKCQHLEKENQLLREELLPIKIIQKNCEKLEEHKKKLEREIVSLKSLMEKNMLEYGQVEQYKREIEERTAQDLIEKIKWVRQFLQTQEECQEKLEQLKDNENASMRSEMDLRIRDLELKLSEMRSQIDCNKIEMENYKQLYLEEVKIRKLLSDKLSTTDKKLVKIQTKLLLERQQNVSLQETTLKTSPVIGSACMGDLSNRFFIPKSFSRESLMISSKNVQPSIEGMSDSSC